MTGKLFKRGIQSEGDIVAINKDVRTRTGNTGGGDLLTRTVKLAPAGYLVTTDTSGVVVGYCGPDGQPASYWVIGGGANAQGGGLDAFNVDLSSGLVLLNGGLQVQAPLNSTDYALKFDDGTTVCGMRAYNSKASTFWEFDADGTFAMRVAAATVTIIVDASLNARQQLTQVTSPANLTASQNNWQPAGTSAVPTNVRFTANASLSLTGLTAGLSGQRMTLWNVGSNSITLAHESASSTTTNRFRCPGATNFTLRADGAVDLWYDPTSARWRVCAP